MKLVKGNNKIKRTRIVKKDNKNIHIQNKNKKTKTKTLKKEKTSYNNKGGNIIMVFEYNKKDDNTITKQKKRCLCIDYDVIVDKKNNKEYYSLENNKGKRRCNHNAEKGKHFCKKHRNCASFLRKYTSGYEPKYEPLEWVHPYVESSHNCYSYFLDDKAKNISEKCEELCIKNHKEGCPKKIKECGDLKPQPGNHYLLLKDGNLDNKKREFQCPKMEKKIMADNPSLYKTTLTQKCGKNHYKGAMVVDPEHTFHFYRQNIDGSWSHKPGTLPVTNVDADNKHIYVPHFANRDYSNEKKSRKPINYTSFCGYYCVPVNDYLDTNAI